MPYTPTTWTEGVTKLGPTNMNHIEAGIAAAIPSDLIDAKGDLIVGSAADTAIRKAIGADGTVLTADAASGGGLKWLDPATVLLALSTVDAKGDLLAGSADNAVSRLAVGTTDQNLVPSAAAGTGLAWVAAGGRVLYDSGHLGAASATIDATGLDQNFRGLRILAYLRGDTAAASTTCLLRFNGDSGANYDIQRMSASAAAQADAESFGQTSATIATVMPANTATANVFGMIEIIVPFYAHASNNKIANALATTKIGVASTNLTQQNTGVYWRSNNAITQVTLIPGAGNWQIASRMIIEGI